MYLWVLCVFLASTAARKSFLGDKLISVVPANLEQLKYLQEVQQTSEVDFWNHPIKVGAGVDVHVTADQLPEVDALFSAKHMTYKIKSNNIQRLIDGERDVSWQPSVMASADVLTRYGSQQEIVGWLEATAAKCGARCTLMPFGSSLEGREMTVIKIVGNLEDRRSKPAAFVDGGIHAREWISPAFVNNMIDKLINDYGSDSTVTAMLDAHDWYIIPLLNPDGYQYSHDTDRMWRKNRAEPSRRQCYGVDLNRNFGYMFGGSGTSTNPCSEIYRGPNAFSEPESQNLRDFLLALDNLEVYLSFHSYGQYLLFPWGYDRDYAPNHDDLDDVGQAGAQTIREITGEQWIVGNAAIELYPSAGASDDWAYGGAGATYAYCIELPPNDADGSGFILPESRIPEVVNSVWPGVKAMMSRIIEKRQFVLPTHYVGKTGGLRKTLAQAGI
ncbi:carboxypeptidase B-like [Watersipora subatra]|uniref:carboxypeptidase B-like n=1 Tax=Watersipora subatra TaxID=2589382 RepID=UPI00355B16EC